MVRNKRVRWTWVTAMFRGSIQDARRALKLLEDPGLNPKRRAYPEGVIEEGKEAAVQLREMGYAVEDP